ncbi:DNA glycosylase [Xylariales sp. PMI_506]|nr:DNA glycosylase [Xylariales sp. PMI_506]
MQTRAAARAAALQAVLGAHRTQDVSSSKFVNVAEGTTGLKYSQKTMLQSAPELGEKSGGELYAKLAEVAQLSFSALLKPPGSKRKRDSTAHKETKIDGSVGIPHNLGPLRIEYTDPAVEGSIKAPRIDSIIAAESEHKQVSKFVGKLPILGASNYDMETKTDTSNGYSGAGSTEPRMNIFSNAISQQNIHPTNVDIEYQIPKRQRRSQHVAIQVQDREYPIIPEDTNPLLKKPEGVKKKNDYDLTPGKTPFPHWTSPSTQQCQEVYEILVELHNDVNTLPPEKIPAPSLDVAGCGEVPSVLDGLIRTVLSGATTFEMADRSLRALAHRFGVLQSGVGQGSVDWNNVRTAVYDEVFEILRPGGLGANKAKNIQAILNMVYNQNLKRQQRFLSDKMNVYTHLPGASESILMDKSQGDPDLSEGLLSLEYIHTMSTDEAIRHFVQYPGVGVKTAACVALFCLQRPCFAVDTHVFRLSRWLGWVPQNADEENTFKHLEVRCPNKLKYGLHQLFIRHGKTCHRCNDKSYQGTDKWNQVICPLEALLDRFGKRLAKVKTASTRIQPA